MFVFVTSHTVYHSKLLSLHFCFFLEFNICHRFGWVYPRCFWCSCSALRIIVCFFSLGHWIVCVLDLLYHDRFPLWHFQTFGHCIVCSSIYGFCFLLISPDYTFDIFNFSFCTLWSPLWCLLINFLFFSDYALDIFRSLRLYLLITPLVSSDYDFGIF